MNRNDIPKHDLNSCVPFSLQEIEWIPKKGCSCICAPYNLTSGETGSSISGVTQDKLLIQTDVSFVWHDIHVNLQTTLKLVHGFENTNHRFE